MDTLEMHMDSLITRMDSLRVHLRRSQRDSMVIHLDRNLSILRDSIYRKMPEIGYRLREGVTPFFLEFGPRSLAGAEFAEMNAGLGKYFHTNEGLLTLQVAPETPAARAGLQPGDVVVEANGNRVDGVGDLRDALVRADGQEVKLTVLREGRRQQISVRWERPSGVRYRVDRRLPERTERVRAQRLRVVQ
jgi:C-terminal processing protease CtpA/Prc